MELLKTTDLTLLAISKTVGCSSNTLQKYAEQEMGYAWCQARTKRLRSIANKGSSNPSYKTGRKFNGVYLMVLRPTWYKSDKRYVPEHHVVFAKEFGMDCIPPDFVVHHIDHDTQNNSVNNLALMPLQLHAAYHSCGEIRDGYGRNVVEFTKWFERYNAA